MSSLVAPSPDGTDNLVDGVLKRRSRPCVLVVDGNLDVAFAEPRALALLQEQFPPHDASSVFPEALLQPLGDLIRRFEQQTTIDPKDAIRAVKGLVLRIVPLFGAQDRLYAVILEAQARREDLRDAVARFSLSPREIEVLEMILRGMTAAEIAATLHIAEVTVFDHFKHISMKTNARNRADMVGKIFNWQGARKTRKRG